jgi:predicted DsbA family dithiol-disulfide isomerase
MQTYLKSDEDFDWVLDMDQQWKEQQIGGVPFFIFNDKYVDAHGLCTAGR